MKNFVALAALFQYFHGDEINTTAFEKNDWFTNYKELKNIVSTLMPLLSNSPYADQRVDVTCLARRGNLGILEILLTHIAFYSFISTKKKEAIEATKKLSKEHQIIINKIIQPDLPSTTKQERPKPTPEQVILTNSTLTDRLAELRSKIEELTNSNNKLKSENENLRSQIWRVWRSKRLKNNLQNQIQKTIKMMKLAMLNKIQHYKFLI